MTGFYQRMRVPPDVRWSKPDRLAAARSLQTMLERPAKRLIVGHADIIEEGCRDQLAKAWRQEGVQV